MAHCLSNMLISQPTSLCPNLSPSNSRFVAPLPSSRNPSRNGGRISVVKSMADEGRDNLDYLQRQQQNQHPKKKSAPLAPVGLWDRFPTARTVQQMLETMERIVDDPFAYGGEWRSPPPPPPRTPWEIKEGEAEYKMRFDMPGMTKDDVRIWVEENMLVLKAEKSAKNKNDDEDEGGGDEWPVKSYGRYSSRIALPENVEFEKIKAEVKDGVLYLNIPKAKTSPKVFDVSVQ